MRGIAAEVLSLLMAHDWPGNIRELENAVEHAFILFSDGYIGIAHLPAELTAHGAKADPDADVCTAHDLLDAQAIRAALERHAFNSLEGGTGSRHPQDHAFPQDEETGHSPFRKSTAAAAIRVLSSADAPVYR